MTAVKAVLFDCDGVLLDTEPPGCAALAQALTEAGWPMKTEEARRIFSGKAASDTLLWLEAAGLPAAAVFARSDAILFDGFTRHIPLIDGIEAVLADFDLQMAVCSNASKKRLDLSLCRTPLAARFGRHIWSADHVTNPKPAPDLALHACREFGIAPAQALFIDDNYHGIHCAKAAGCVAVGFIAPSDSRPDHGKTLRDAGADYVVHGMGEFHALLASLTFASVE
ncbi:HAD family hydrolase [Falsigemmobacter intermedius]|uniref:HAD family phosphatase n=1 Tax=Falsigemmobacter intermedius TaxID=1553448 RepID=A0A3S3UD23_9RHOB|nr:HAD family phosphatase [Falsigemmobacter intermedius]RWY41588.1 HAD family phosphatase [Falsigemmobacter intermedius]